MASALINVPRKAKRGEIIEIKTLMSHIMETGYRHTSEGEVVPRDIITSFACRYNGVEIFRADLFPAIAANPFITFFTIATESGKFEFEWIGDKGFSEIASASITVAFVRYSTDAPPGYENASRPMRQGGTSSCGCGRAVRAAAV